MIFGYARVSTDGQSVDVRVKALRVAGAEKVFRETASGAKSDRRELARALKALGDGDTLLVTRLDRLARSARDLLNTLDADRQGRSASPIAGQRMGGPDDRARALVADLLKRYRRVRARIDPCPRRRGEAARQGARRPYGSPLPSRATSARKRARRWRTAPRRRPISRAGSTCRVVRFRG